MNQNQGNITIWTAFSVLLLSAGLVSHVMIIPVILDVAKRDAWISVLFAAPFYILWMLLLYYIMKQLKNRSLVDWFEQSFGKTVAVIFRIIAICFLFASCLYTTHDTAMWTVTTYMQVTPFFVLVLLFILIAFLMALSGFKNIAMTASILLPTVLFLGYFVMIANYKYKDYSLLKPMFEFGMMPAFIGSAFVLSGFMESWILLLYQHQLQKKIKAWQIIALAFFMISMAIGPTLSSITEFGPMEAAKQRYSAFEQWKIVKLGLLLQHIDFLSIYQWLSGALVRVATSIYLISSLLTFKSKKINITILTIVTIFVLLLVTYPWRDDVSLLFLQHIYAPALLIFVSILTILVTIALVFQRKQGHQNNNQQHTLVQQEANDSNE
ncbi:endospore germination permease [Paenibacillus yanchengensis]|uniref:Endospore germination permease n=1 Tax=Paenibacillus yanchengensis TaxID=2035833 RepID=A0ABW4YFW5_9BACL